MLSQIETTSRQAYVEEINRKFAEFVEIMLIQLEQDLYYLKQKSMFAPIKGAIDDARKRYEKMSFEEREKRLKEFQKENK